MTGFTFLLEQLRAAPLEVRRWLKIEIGAALASLNRLEPSPPEPHRTELAACTPQEAARMFELIKDNFRYLRSFRARARNAAPRRPSAVLCFEHRRNLTAYAA